MLQEIQDWTSESPSPAKQPRTNHRQFLVPLNILSVGKWGIFDARAESCCITNSAISCKVKIEGSCCSITIQPHEVQTLVFSESLQVIFLRPTENYRLKLSEILKLESLSKKNPSAMKWIILVLLEPLVNGPPHITTHELEIFAQTVRKCGGFCKMLCTHQEARTLLCECGLRLRRAELLDDDQESIKDKINSSETLKLSSTNNDIHGHNYSKDTSCPTDVQSKHEGGLLTNVISTLSATGNKLLNNIVSIKTVNEKEESECDDLIILSEDDLNNRSVNFDTNNATPTNKEFPPTDSSNTDDVDLFKFDYKPPGSTDSLTLTSGDLECLAPGALLNDTIINFYLKYLYYEQLTDFQQHATYLFNVFFYSRLAASCSSNPCLTNPSRSALSRNSHSDSSKADSDSYEAMLERHKSVAKWTRRVDLFSKDYIIIPINECSHWFLGLVCYPWMVGMVSYTALYQVEAYDLCQLTEEFVDVDQLHYSMDLTSDSIGYEIINRKPTDGQGEAFDRWRRRRLAWLRKRGVNAMPCILLFDSLPCQSRVGNLHVIRDYLQIEWDTRRAKEDGRLKFNKDTIRGFSPRVPSQSNLVDCGIYLLHYVEMFFNQPVKSYTKDYFQHEMSSWFPEATIENKRNYIQQILMELRKRTLANS